MTVRDLMLMLGPIVATAVLGMFIGRSESRRQAAETRTEEQRKETGKRIGRLERRMDIELGRRLGAAEVRKTHRRGNA